MEMQVISPDTASAQTENSTSETSSQTENLSVLKVTASSQTEPDVSDALSKILGISVTTENISV